MGAAIAAATGLCSRTTVQPSTAEFVNHRDASFTLVERFDLVMPTKHCSNAKQKSVFPGLKEIHTAGLAAGSTPRVVKDPHQVSLGSTGPENIPSAKPLLVHVIGMHRSGTSTVTEALMQLGLELEGSSFLHYPAAVACRHRKPASRSFRLSSPRRGGSLVTASQRHRSKPWAPPVGALRSICPVFVGGVVSRSDPI